MVHSDNLRNLRAGPVIRAAGYGLKDATVRKWIASDGLILADRATRETGNPRYDLADAGTLFMLDQLTRRLRMAAAPAVHIVNCARPHLLLLAEYELAAIDDPSEPPKIPRFICSFLDAFTPTDPVILLHDSERARAERESPRGRWLEVTMDLRELVREARNRLIDELGLSRAGLRYDFADAPDPHHDDFRAVPDKAAG